MAANPISNGDVFEAKKGKTVYTSNDDNTTGNGNGGENSLEGNKDNDGDVIITPTKESYRHKKEGFIFRSFKAVEDYEKDGTLPKRKRKEKEIINIKKEIEEELSKKKKEEAEINRICVEKFLAEAHYNLLHWFD
ncbi:hypothetical protein RYX36_016538 [Vicia faba]